MILSKIPLLGDTDVSSTSTKLSPSKEDVENAKRPRRRRGQGSGYLITTHANQRKYKQKYGSSRLCVIIFAYGIVKCLLDKTFKTILRIFYQYRPRFHTETRRADFIKKINQLTRKSSFYQRFNECRYSHVKGYIDHDDVIFSMARLLTSYQCYDADIFEMDFTHRTSLIILDRAYQKGFGSYWLSESLFDAFCNSQLPNTVGQLKQVILSGVLLLPPKLKNPDGQSLKWLCFFHRLADQTIAPIEIMGSRLEIGVAAEDTLSWFTVFDDGTQYGVHRCLKVDENLQLDYQDENEMFIDRDLARTGLNTVVETEKEFTDQVTDLLVQTLLYLQQKSDFSVSPSRSSVKNSGKNRKLTPHIIGRDYRIRSESERDAPTDRQYRTHWCRGFYRWQPYGHRERPDRKLIWIEPVLVNG